MPWQADPETSTRERFTEVNLMFRLPEGADKDYAEIFKTSQHLYRLLAYHPAMKPNLQQTFNTPANSKNKVYFSAYMQDVPLSLEDLTDAENERYFDIMGRTFLIKQLLLDTRPGLLETMTESTYPDQKGNHPELGNEILDAARALPFSEAPAAGVEELRTRAAKEAEEALDLSSQRLEHQST